MEISPPLWALSQGCTILVGKICLYFLKTSLGLDVPKLDLTLDATWWVPCSSGEALPSTGLKGSPRPWSATEATRSLADAGVPCSPPGPQSCSPDYGFRAAPLLGSSQPGAGHSICPGCAPACSWQPISAGLRTPSASPPVWYHPQCPTSPLPGYWERC